MDYCELKKFIPKDKFDLTPISALMEMSRDEIKPILPYLLPYVADMNWPIASEMVKVLACFADDVVPHIKEILKPTEIDEDWKWFIITGLIPELPKKSQDLLAEDIRRISDNPTDSEVLCDVQKQAEIYLKRQ